MPPHSGQGQTTPEMFAQLLEKLITPGVAEKVINGVKTLLREAPTKLYDVFRQTPTGGVPQSISLPQALVELTDQLKIQNELQRYAIQVSERLTAELQENRKFGVKVLKRQKQREDEDDEQM